MSRKDSMQQLRAALLRRREALRRAVAAEMNELTNAPVVVGDSADTALEGERDELCTRLSANASRELRLIESALQRARHGRYGVCESCGKKIPVVRLQALPYATHCVTCQRSADRAELPLPAIRPELAGAFGDEEFAAPYEAADV